MKPAGRICWARDFRRSTMTGNGSRRLSERSAVALGVVRFAADPDNRRAEYAIAVRSDWKGRGLGYLLLSRLLMSPASAGSASCSARSSGGTSRCSIYALARLCRRCKSR